MKRIFCLIMVFVAVFAFASCSKKKSHDYEERVSKKISAEDGGTVESSDGNTSVEIPAGALDEDTKITMTVYDASGYSDEKGKIVSRVVEFEPSGTIFKKPVIITIAADEKIEKKTISAAVYKESEEKWSYSQGFYVILDKNEEGGDPIMKTTDGKEVVLDNGNLTTAGGDQIMMTDAAGDPIMTNAAGDPIMMSAAGDPIMLASNNAAGDPIMTNAAGDPIMTSAAGDPIMNAAAGDPIMMTTGHFTTFTFIAFDPRKGEQVEPADDSDDVEMSDDDDSEISDVDDEEPVNDKDEIPDEVEDEDIVPEPEKVYSLVPCTGFTSCANDKDEIIDCPLDENDDFYGQDAQYAFRRSCVPRSFERIESAEEEDVYPMVLDNVTKLTWLLTDIDFLDYLEDDTPYFCTTLNEPGYAGYSDWRLPTPKELQTLFVHNKSVLTSGSVLPQTYFHGFYSNQNDIPAVAGNTYYYLSSLNGYIYTADGFNSYYRYLCVRGEEYGKVDENTYEIRGEGNEKVVFDSSTNLLWQKGSVSGKTWKEALKYCESLDYAGYSDWRLPNRNELMSLVDYSKAGSGMVSSFPGMEEDRFISSTFSFGFPEVGYEIEQWTVSMPNGVLGHVYEEDDLYLVRCVRSDLDAAPADGIPECDEKIGYTPCRDSANGIVWSRVIMEPEEDSGYEWYGSVAAEACNNAVMHGKNKWRLPTVDELRTLVKADKLKAGGECGVTSTCLDRSCYEEDKCTFDEDYVFESKFFDYEMLVSGDVVDNDDHFYDKVWVIDPDADESGFSELSIYEDDSYSRGYIFSTVVRCVLDETLPKEEVPYTDPDTGLSWSDISMKVTYPEAKAYCASLTEESGGYWRLPAVTELQTLVVNCEEDSCKMVMSGIYSVFGDIGYLWAENEETNALDFYTAEAVFLEDHSLYSSYNAKVRCVSGGSDPCVFRNLIAATAASVTPAMRGTAKHVLLNAVRQVMFSRAQILQAVSSGLRGSQLQRPGLEPFHTAIPLKRADTLTGGSRRLTNSGLLS